jgi:hypothetical protein
MFGIKWRAEVKDVYGIFKDYVKISYFVNSKDVNLNEWRF